MAQYLELVLKRDFPSGWRHTLEKVGLILEKPSEVAEKEKTEKTDWRDRAGKNWFY